MSDARYHVPPPRGSLAHRLLRRHRLALRLGAGTVLQAFVDPGAARVPSPTYYQGLPLDQVPAVADEAPAMLPAPLPGPPAAPPAPAWDRTAPAAPRAAGPAAPPTEQPGASAETVRSLPLSHAQAAAPDVASTLATQPPQRPGAADDRPAGVAALAAPLLASLRALAERLPGQRRQGQDGPSQNRRVPAPPAVPQPSDLHQRPGRGEAVQPGLGRLDQAMLVPAPAPDLDAGRAGGQGSTQPAAMPGSGPGDEPPDDSPAAWAARLFGPPSPSQAPATSARAPDRVARVTPPAPDVGQGQPQGDQAATPAPVRGAGRHPGEPLRESTRRFLRPLVGIDPAEARIMRGPHGDQASAAHAADAVTAGDTIAFAAGQGDESPAGLGLLAHELTHVARQRDPGFIPPVLQRSAGGHLPVAPRSEEALALQVEQEIRRAARRKMGLEPAEPIPTTAPRPEAAAAAGPAVPGAPGRVSAAAAAPALAAATSIDQSTIPTEPLGQSGRSWGDMPAPWEPMPFWQSGTASGAAAPRAAPASATLPEHAAAVTAGPSPAPAAASGAPAIAPATGIQAAARDRSLFDDRQPPPQPAPAPTIAPDLDAMARDVYAILRRRLLAEQRRSQDV